MSSSGSQIDEVSKLLGELVAGQKNLGAQIEDMRLLQSARAIGVEQIASDVHKLTTSMALVQSDICEMKPKVVSFNEVRLKAIGALAGIGMLTGIFGSYLAKKVGIG